MGRFDEGRRFPAMEDEVSCDSLTLFTLQGNKLIESTSGTFVCSSIAGLDHQAFLTSRLVILVPFPKSFLAVSSQVLEFPPRRISSVALSLCPGAG